jgi:peroxiredoxin (alkyl hydroperoxide reductase subunit C)
MPAFDKRVKDFEAVNTQVLGISTDSPFSHENWAKSVGISNYRLLSDTHRTVGKDYGVYWPAWNANLRASFIVNRQGRSPSSSTTARATCPTRTRFSPR